MSESVEFVARAILIGVGGTVTMDLWAAALRRVGIASLNMALLGRWAAHLLRGRWRHTSIAAAAEVSHETTLGWAAHYTIGVTFAALLLWTQGLSWAQSPTLGPALLVGLVTVAAPLLILQPGMGGGIAFRNTPTPLFNTAKSVVTHTVFGVGMYLAAEVTAALELY
ncbi:MAG: hypothetical protein AMXMBFR57_23600 [Acidimicrobiia bacterium]|jgi:hypothetical protein